MIRILLLFGLTMVACKTSDSEVKGLSMVKSDRPTDDFLDPLWSGNLWSGIYHLALIRDGLIRRNLIDAYLEPPKTIKCTWSKSTHRTADGSCYSADKPYAGAAGSRFGRNFPLQDASGERETLLSPNPRTISRQLMTREQFIPASSVNLLVGAWIQFMIHDWILHAKNTQKTIDVPLEIDNPFGKPTMQVPSTPNDRRGAEKHFSSINTVTSWWDGSQIYGSSRDVQLALRTLKGGELKIARNNILPLNSRTGQEIAGNTENWWLGLSLMHHIFVLEHNRIARHLAKNYPKFSDEVLFQKARLINAALMAKIHTVEWTPAVLQHEIMKVAMNTNWYGLAKGWEAPTKGITTFMPSSLAFLHGIVGLPDVRDFGVPYSLTESFTTVYRMHQFLPDQFTVRDQGGQMQLYDLADVIRQKSRPLLEKHGLAAWIESFGKAHPGALVLNNYPSLLQNIPLPDSMNLDLAAVDVLRDRERGVPRYNAFRRGLKMPPAKDFSDITANKKHLEQLRSLYKDVEEVDAIIGMLAEDRRPAGFAFGETQFRIFVLMASRRLFSDPFFTERFTAQYYTAEGLQWIDRNSMSTVLLAHFPGAFDRYISAESNAFLPWQ